MRGWRRRRRPPIIASVEQPTSGRVRDHNLRVCRFAGWVASTGERRPWIRVLGLERSAEFRPSIPRPDVVAALDDGRITDPRVGFEFYVDLPRFDDDHLSISLEFTDGQATTRSGKYRLLRDVDPRAAATYFGDTHAKRELARAQLSGRGLEFGALHLPLAVDPARCEMDYADRLSKAEALEMFPELQRDFSERIVEPDLIVDVALDDLSSIEGHEYDFFVANDVIEHLPNPIAFLANVARLMKPGAKLFISIPDRDYSFDVLRDPTPFDHLWDEYERGVSEVSDEHLEEFIVGTGLTLPADPDARRQLLDQHQARSIHVHVWDQRSFDAFLAETIDRLELGFRIVGRLPSREAGGSMVYVLEKE